MVKVDSPTLSGLPADVVHLAHVLTVSLPLQLTLTLHPLHSTAHMLHSMPLLISTPHCSFVLMVV